MYGPALAEEGERVNDSFLEQQTPGYQRPWRGDLKEEEEPEKISGLLYSQERRKVFVKRLQVCSCFTQVIVSYILTNTPRITSSCIHWSR